MAKALTLDMDAVIFDLEDSIAEHAKQTAQENLAAFFNAAAVPAFFRIIRINALSHPQALADLELAGNLSPDAILLPKVEEPETTSHAAAAMLKPGKATRPALWTMIERPKRHSACCRHCCPPCCHNSCCRAE